MTRHRHQRSRRHSHSRAHSHDRSGMETLPRHLALDVRGERPPVNGGESRAADALSLSTACDVQTASPRLRLRIRKWETTPAPTTRTESSRPRSRVLTGSDGGLDYNDNPLDDPAFLAGLQAAGYLEPLDTSRKAIKARYTHGLQKEEFAASLAAFLDELGIRARGEYMIRFGGTPTEVHSPFVHLFTTSLPTVETPHRVVPDVSDPTTLAMWTPLKSEKDSESLWACKARRFWRVRVVLEGNAPPPAPDFPHAEAPQDDRARRRKRRDTFQREVDLDEEIRNRERKEALELLQNTDINAVSSATIKSQSRAIKVDTSVSTKVLSSATGDEAQSPSTPTILESVKQLGQSVAANLGPAVQQLPTTMNKSINELRDWFAQRQLPSPFEDEVEAEEERRRKEKRRRRRERRRREAEAADAPNRGDSSRDSCEANNNDGARRL